MYNSVQKNNFISQFISDNKGLDRNILIEQNYWRMGNSLYSEIRESRLKIKMDIGNIEKA